MCPVRMQIKKIIQEIKARGAETKEHKSGTAHYPWVKLNLVGQNQRKKEQNVFRPMMPPQCSCPSLQRRPLHRKCLLYAGQRRGSAGYSLVSHDVCGTCSLPDSQI